MKRYFILFAWCLSTAGFAQKYYNDAQLWFNFYLEKKLNRYLDIHLNQQDRWEQNITRYVLGYADVGLTFRFNKNIKILADYVYTKKQDNRNFFRTRHQFYVAFSAKKDIRRWRFIYRNMLQLQYNDPFTTRSGFFPYYKDRNKFTIKYQINKRIDLYTAAELYIPLNLPNKKFYPDRVRYFGGMFINTFRHQQLELYFMNQEQLNNDIWYAQQKRYPNALLTNYYVYGVGYSIIF